LGVFDFKVSKSSFTLIGPSAKAVGIATLLAGVAAGVFPGGSWFVLSVVSEGIFCFWFVQWSYGD
jgi:hypothetical protein